MHKLLVMYPEPTDRGAFKDYYENQHLPLASKLPNVVGARYSLDVTALEGDSPYFAIFEADFESAEAMGGALMSPEGAAVAADVPNYATGGAHLVHYEVPDATDVATQVIRQYLDHWNSHDVDAIVAMFADAGEYLDPSLPAPVTGEDLAQHLKNLFGAVPNLHLDVLGAGSDGPSTAVAFWHMTGAVAVPEGKQDGNYDLHGSDIVKVDAHGKITWTAALYDQLAFLNQSGIPVPVEA